MFFNDSQGSKELENKKCWYVVRTPTLQRTWYDGQKTTKECDVVMDW